MKNFSEFWPFYVREHRHPVNRQLHFTGTMLAITCVAWGTAAFDWRCFLLAPIFGYSLAWLGHFAIQKNKPATFKYPVWSFIGDFKMFALMANGRMADEIVRLELK